jgi:hypothetical protein
MLVAICENQYVLFKTETKFLNTFQLNFELIRANDKLVPKFHVALHVSYSALPCKGHEADTLTSS